MFEQLSNILGIQQAISQKKAVRDLIQTSGDPVTRTNTSKMTISLPFKCDRQFYIEPNAGAIHRGYEVRLKRLYDAQGRQSRIMSVLLMQLQAVRDNYAHFSNAPVVEAFVDPRENYPMPPHFHPAMPPPGPPPGQRMYQVPPAHEPPIRDDHRGREVYEEEEVGDQESELTEQERFNANAQNNGNNNVARGTIQQDKLQQMIKVLSITNPELFNVMSWNSTPSTSTDAIPLNNRTPTNKNNGDEKKPAIGGTENNVTSMGYTSATHEFFHGPLN